MSDNFRSDHDERHSGHVHEHQVRQPEQAPALSGESEDKITYPNALVGDPRLASRGNAHVRASAMGRAQQTHGNRAVQRFMHGGASLSQNIQRDRPAVGAQGGPLPDEITRSVEAMRGSGAPLDGSLRAGMERAFGEGLGDVNIHQGREADALNRSLGARAFTTGSDIFFREGADPSDRRLLAHEVTHVLQQRGSTENVGGPLSVGPQDDAYEREAHQAASSVTSGEPAQVRQSAGALVSRDLFDGLTLGDWQIKPPTWKGETDDTYDTPENRRRAERQAEDERGESPTPPKWWEGPPKFNPKSPAPWLPKITVKPQPEPIVVPPKGPDERGDYPIPPTPEDEEYGFG